MLVRLPVIGAAFGVDVSRERDGDAFLHEGRRHFALGRRDQIHRAELVVLTPAAPVRQLRFPQLIFGLADRRPSAGCGKRLWARPPASASPLTCALTLRLTCGRRLILALSLAPR